MEYFAGKADVAVIGAGHAGIEASLAAARMGCRTVLFTISNDAVGNMPCNPSIGGTGKGQLVFEIDALGGEMGKAADKVMLQDRMLNLSKGPAVHSKRIQADRRLYQDIMKKTIEHTENLSLVQAEICEIRRLENDNDGMRFSLVTRLSAVYHAKTVVICTGTYLDSRVIIGDVIYPSGPDGLHPASYLSKSIELLGIKMLRFKTGTPPRIDARTVDYSVLERQDGDEKLTPYSADTDIKELESRPRLPCYIVYTNEETHKIIREHISESPLYSGKITGIGPRYCPSIEDKVVRFPDKIRHQLFLEPMGEGSNELYLQGFSSSMPSYIQDMMLHSIKGLENAVVMRSAYAIEYDCIDSTELSASLMFKKIPGLFGAGQFNGTSGYEEAAAQGLIAGMNAALFVKEKPPVILTRNSSYIGTLIDDLVTKGTNEPYRMMTSRSEFRLILRQDNADERLSEIGYEAGLLPYERIKRYREKKAMIEAEKSRLRATVLPPSEKLNDILSAAHEPPIRTGVRLSELLKRPEITYASLAPVDEGRKPLPENVIFTAQTDLKYEGYIKKELADAERFSKLEKRLLPEDICYKDVLGLSTEAAQKLEKFRPVSIGAASRISGVSPADISVLLIFLDIKNKD
ncbi:MAG: tRNA uridine-5-carboxymethylaminomethyl(34) synthesis enzyme MnmG, partial [Eubacteriales bacterium]